MPAHKDQHTTLYSGTLFDCQVKKSSQNSGQHGSTKPLSLTSFSSRRHNPQPLYLQNQSPDTPRNLLHPNKRTLICCHYPSRLNYVEGHCGPSHDLHACIFQTITNQASVRITTALRHISTRATSAQYASRNFRRGDDLRVRTPGRTFPSPSTFSCSHSTLCGASLTGLWTINNARDRMT